MNNQNLIDFLKIISTKSHKYQLAWILILSKADKEKTVQFSVYEIVSKTKIPIKTLYPILNFGFDYFKNGDFEIQFGIKNNIIYIYDRSEKDKFSFLKRKEITKKILTIKNKPLKIKSKTQNQKKQSSIAKIDNNHVELIINCLNQKSGKDFSPNSSLTIKLINKRMEEGFTLENFFYVIELKVNQWSGGLNEKYIRPETLFGDKMESYLNELPITQTQQIKNPSKAMKIYEAAKLAIRSNGNTSADN